MIRRLIVPLTAAVVTLHAGQVFAQGAFPAPLPNQSAAPAGASPFPPVNGAPSASVGAPSAFPSQGAAPVSRGFSAPPPQASGSADACMKGFIPLREEAEKRGKMIKAASDRKASGRGLQADRQFRPGRTEDDQICRDQLGEVRNSAPDRRPAPERPQEHREDAEAGLRDGRASAGAGACRSEPERS